MKKNLYFLFLLILPVSLFSQLVENAPPFFHFFNDTPHYEIKPDGFGSFGFNNPLSNFNPKYQERANNLMFSSGGNFNIHTSVYQQSWNNSRHFDLYDEVVSVKPDFTVDYQIENFSIPEIELGTYQFRISHFTDLNIKTISNFGIGGISGGFIDDFVSSKTNSVLQFSVIKKVSEAVSLSGSYITNQFLYSVDLPGYRKQSIRSNFFDQKQLQASLNISLPSINLYLLGKTQEAAINLSPGRLRVLEEVFYGDESRDVPTEHPIYNNTILSYPGIFAVGVQHRISNRFKISLESVNHFLIAKEKLGIKYPLYYDEVEVKFKHDIINKELVAGLNYQASAILNLGTSLSYYLNYNYSGDHDDEISPSYRLNEVQNPLTAIFASSYELGKFSLGMHYQYSYARVKFLENEYNDSYSQTNQIHQLKLSVNYGIL